MLLQDEAGLPQEPATPCFRLNYAEIAMQRTELELQDQERTGRHAWQGVAPDGQRDPIAAAEADGSKSEQQCLLAQVAGEAETTAPACAIPSFQVDSAVEMPDGQAYLQGEQERDARAESPPHEQSRSAPAEQRRSPQAVVQTAFRSGRTPVRIPEIHKRPSYTSPVQRSAEAAAAQDKSKARILLPPEEKPLTWQPEGGATSPGVHTEGGATSPGVQTASQNGSRSLPPASRVADSPRFDPSFGPPPPPFIISKKVWDGLDDYPEASWGQGHLAVVNRCSASAKFGGGGSIDVPAVCSNINVSGPAGRTYWEMRIDKKVGLLKFGLGHFHAEGPGDPGLNWGDNWTDRRGNGCTWYLESDQGDIFEGTKCLCDGPAGANVQAGDVVSIELINGKASFFVNYKLHGSVMVQKWPVKMCVLFVFQGDHVTLLRNEHMPPAEFNEWMQNRDQRAAEWCRVVHKKLQLQQPAAQVTQRDKEREEAREREQARNREKLEIERIRVETEIAEKDREREERKRRELQARVAGEKAEHDESANLSRDKNVSSPSDSLESTGRQHGWKSEGDSNEDKEVLRLRKERDDARQELERAREQLESLKVHGGPGASARSIPQTQPHSEGDEGLVTPCEGAGGPVDFVDGLAVDEDEYEGGEEFIGTEDEYTEYGGGDDQVCLRRVTCGRDCLS
jgi:hypothetical protein